MAATILCRFLDADGNEFVGQPTATDAETGLATEVQLLATQDIFGDLALGEEKKAVSKVLAPLDPKAILCIGLNYAKHAAESGMAVPVNPVLFMKTVSTLNHPGDPIDLPKIESKPDWEVELAIVIGKAAKNVSEAEALDSVLGYTCANDVSGREWQIGASLQPSQRPSASPAGSARRQRPQAVRQRPPQAAPPPRDHTSRAQVAAQGAMCGRKQPSDAASGTGTYGWTQTSAAGSGASARASTPSRRSGR